MWGAIKAVPETIKNWRENRDVLYQAVTGLSALLVVVAVATGTRPSDSLAAAARSVGATAVADWFTTNAPPLLAVTVPSVQTTALSIVLILLAVMVVVPLWRSRHDDNGTFGYEQLRLIGSPAAATIWLPLLVAAQQGDIAPTLQRWAQTMLWVSAWTIGALIIAGVLYLAANRYGSGELVDLLLWPVMVVVYRTAVGVCAALSAVAFAAVSLPLSIVSWMSGLESDHSHRARYEIERERAERIGQPTGAASRPDPRRVDHAYSTAEREGGGGERVAG